MDFNPYTEWLAVPPSKTPPHYYELLGLQEFESNPERIRQSAARRKDFVRKQLEGPYAPLAQRILEEIGRAEETLVDPARKEAYDRKHEGEVFLGDASRAEDASLRSAESGSLAVESPSQAPIREDARRWPFALRVAVIASLATLLLMAGIVALQAFLVRPPAVAPADPQTTNGAFPLGRSRPPFVPGNRRQNRD